jgi:glutamyl-tRNA synthetase
MEKNAKFVARHQAGKTPLALQILTDLIKAPGLRWKPEKEATAPELSFFPSGDVLKGELVVARYIARAFPDHGLYGNSALAASEVDQWLEFVFTELNTHHAEEKFLTCMEDLNTHLQMRTYFAGYSLTIADIFIWAFLQESALWQSVYTTNKKLKCSNVVRWFAYLESIPAFAAIAKAAPTAAAAKKSTEKAGQGVFVELEGAEMGKVVTRFPPEPSGFLHIGHCKAALLNNFYARKYNGKLIVRFDDTNPAKEKVEYVENIKRDLKTLGVEADVISHTSDFFEEILKYAEQMIKDGLAYCDATEAEEMKKQRMAMVESKYRTNTLEENEKMWKEMKEGTALGKTYCLRAKIDMKSKNGTLRDPVLYRCVDEAHHRTGRKYKLYPTYDMACPIVDSIEGVTHALRTTEYHDRDEQYKWLQKAMKLRPVKIQDYSRLNFSYTLLSKRKLQWFVDQKFVDGWDDPRFPTVQGMNRRGLTIKALTDFIIDQGFSKAVNLMDMDKLWALNKQHIDPIIPRYTAISREHACLVTLLDAPQTPEAVSVSRHKKNADLGKKIVFHYHKIMIEQDDAKRLVDNEELTLMDWGNIILKKITKDGNGVVTHIEAVTNPGGDFRTTKNKLTWIPDLPEHLVNVELVEFDTLISKPKLEETDKLEGVVRPQSKFLTAAIGDPNLRNIQYGDIFQLERRGYFRCDKILGTDSPLVLFKIPDGHKSNPSLLTTKVAHAETQAKK